MDEARWKGVALDGIATIAPYGYSALDPKSMEERGIRQSRRKPKFPYVSFRALRLGWREIRIFVLELRCRFEFRDVVLHFVSLIASSEDACGQ